MHNPVFELMETGIHGDNLGGPALLQVSSFAATQKAALWVSVSRLSQLTSWLLFSEVPTIDLDVTNFSDFYANCLAPLSRRLS
jgi:hypothetical protein